MKNTIASRLAGLIHNPYVFDGVHCGPQLTEFTLVTAEEVGRETAQHHDSLIVAHRLRTNVRIETM